MGMSAEAILCYGFILGDKANIDLETEYPILEDVWNKKIDSPIKVVMFGVDEEIYYAVAVQGTVHEVGTGQGMEIASMKLNFGNCAKARQWLQSHGIKIPSLFSWVLCSWYG